MNANVLYFPPISPGVKEPHSLAGGAPEDQRIRLDVEDDLYEHMGVCAGAVLVAEADSISEGEVHYVELEGYGFLATLTRCMELTVHVFPLDLETPSGTYRRAQLDYVGRIVEYYPCGVGASCWTLKHKEGNMERPLIEAIAN